MGPNASWFVLMAAGAACLWLMKLTPPAVDRVLVRLAGCLWLAAGLAGLDGWAGRAVAGLLRGTQSLMDSMGQAAVGSALYWILAAALGLSWLAGMLPDNVIRGKLPTWLICAGLILPPMLAEVPGRFGSGLRAVIYTAGNAVGHALGGMVS